MSWWVFRQTTTHHDSCRDESLGRVWTWEQSWHFKLRWIKFVITLRETCRDESSGRVWTWEQSWHFKLRWIYYATWKSRPHSFLAVGFVTMSGPSLKEAFFLSLQRPSLKRCKRKMMPRDSLGLFKVSWRPTFSSQ